MREPSPNHRPGKDGLTNTEYRLGARRDENGKTYLARDRDYTPEEVRAMAEAYRIYGRGLVGA